MAEPTSSYQPEAPCKRSEIKGYASLEELALDLHWSWSHIADKIWQELDPVLWEMTHNPWVVLQTVSMERLEAVLADPKFCQNVCEIIDAKRHYDQTNTWFKQNHANSSLSSIAYFSMEYMLSEALPIYSGGLGNVAGDQLKAASDLGVPVVAVGLLYQQGYFRQTIDRNGSQQALYPYNDPGQLPITPLRKPNGEWLRLEVGFPGWSIWIRTWQVRVGRAMLYLLDTNDAANFPAYRAITSELYGGGPDLRLKQEILLGIGGWRLLEALNIHPEVCHLNEGHAAFAILERARHYMLETGHNFETALAATRAGNLFTTHTAVPAGFDRYSPDLMEQYLGPYAVKLGITMRELLALGRQNPEDSAEPFNMAYLAIRGSGAINGVSRLHGKVSRQIFSPLFPRWPEEEIPVGHVTNGVHMPSWDSISADALWTEMCGTEFWRWSLDFKEKDIESFPDARLWQMRNEARKSTIEYTRSRLAHQLAVRGSSMAEIEQAKHFFDENTLTLGFARRFATYKRPNMLLHDPERLLRILTNPRYPVQLIIAGKAHPADKPGQALIQQWVNFIQRPEARRHVIFLEDYDILLCEKIVQGVDVWVNTPRRPWEACGTSGMKVLVNGGLNLSELDGWWAEAYSPEVGWAIGDGKEHGDDPSWDAAEANALYNILEHEIIPEFYKRDQEGIPIGWVRKMRASMARLATHFSANRTVREYTERYYLPAAACYQARVAEQGSQASKIVQWKQSLDHNWSKIRFGDVKATRKEDQYEFEVHVYLNGIDPRAIKVELYAIDAESGVPIQREMSPVRQLSGDLHTYVYSAQVSAKQPENSYTARIIPFFPHVAVPLETSYILWQK
jgi:starch phosphorylase